MNKNLKYRSEFITKYANIQKISFAVTTQEANKKPKKFRSKFAIFCDFLREVNITSKFTQFKIKT